VHSGDSFTLNLSCEVTSVVKNCVILIIIEMLIYILAVISIFSAYLNLHMNDTQMRVTEIIFKIS